MKKVEIARDFGAEVAIASGLSASDRVIASPLDSIGEGDEVRVVTATNDARSENGKGAPTSREADKGTDPAVVQETGEPPPE
jgi:hypothetical protein